MTYEQVVQLISAVGFPIVMCGYMIVVLNKSLETLNSTVAKLCATIESFKDELHK